MVDEASKEDEASKKSARNPWVRRAINLIRSNPVKCIIVPVAVLVACAMVLIWLKLPSVYYAKESPIDDFETVLDTAIQKTLQILFYGINQT